MKFYVLFPREKDLWCFFFLPYQKEKKEQPFPQFLEDERKNVL